MKLPQTSRALQESLGFATKELHKPCNHQSGDIRKLVRLIELALAEVAEVEKC